MTTDQWIQIASATGTWLAGFATVGAVILSLHLSRKSEKVRLKVHAGVRLLIAGDGTLPRNYVGVDVTNIGSRNVTVNTIGWSVGRGKKRRYCIQTIYDSVSAQYPVELLYGKSATFLVSLDPPSDWVEQFSENFVQDLSNRNLKTLKAQVHTSVGHTIESPVEDSLRDLLVTGILKER